MVITKKFVFEGAHIVRNCSSERCKKSIHGHSYTVEVSLSAAAFDNGGMVYDFGLLKGTIKDLIDSFDHAYSMWSKESEEFKDFIKSNSARWIEMPVTPSAECYAVMFLFIIDRILENTIMNNGEHFVRVENVTVHETATGRATASRDDVTHLWKWRLEDIKFSEAIQQEWQNPDMWKQLIERKRFVNKKIEKHINYGSSRSIKRNQVSQKFDADLL